MMVRSKAAVLALAMTTSLAMGGQAAAQQVAGKFRYKTIAAVKCWMGSYDDNGNYTAGGCESASTLRGAAPATPVPAATTGSEVVACLAGGDALLPVADNDDVVTCQPPAGRKYAGTSPPSEKAAAVALRACLAKHQGLVMGRGGLVCTG